MTSDLFKDVEFTEDDFHGYQDEAVSYMMDNLFSLILMDMGLGKTAVSLRVLDLCMRNFTAEDIQHALIVAPLRVAANTWPREIAKWRFAAGWPYTLLRVENDDRALDAPQLEAMEAAKRSRWSSRPEVHRAGRLARKIAKDALWHERRKQLRPITIINQEAVPRLVEAWGKKWPYDALIFDEATRLRDHGSEVTKKIHFIRPRFKRIHLLTATPAVQSVEPLFAMTYTVDGGTRFGKYITPFRSRYMVQNAYTKAWSVREGAYDEVMEKIADISLVMKEEDYFDMEKPLVLRRPIRMTDEEFARYEEFEEEAIFTTPEGQEIEAINAASLAQKLLQLGSGTIYDHQLEQTGQTDDGHAVFRKVRSTHVLHRHKTDDLLTLVDELEKQPILVSYWSRASLALLREAFPEAQVLDRKASQEKEWNRGKIPMLLVHPQGAAHGLNLQDGGHHLYLYDLFHHGELYLQLVKRLARQGQKHRVRVHMPTTLRTLDVDVADKLDNLAAGNDAFMTRLQALARAARKRRRDRADAS